MSVTVDTATSRVLPATDMNLVTAATSLIPTLRSRSAETDALARLPDSTIADLEKAQLFNILVPKMYGGLQCSLRTFMDAVVELGRGDGSAAWTVALLSGSTWMAATLYPKHVVDEIFSGGKMPHSGSASRAQGEDKTRGWWDFDRGRIVEF
jgi:3-hydroxy-9,10-secoandrosta-1,3,5(10)-triene-9,17-dione monooxygenase